MTRLSVTAALVIAVAALAACGGDGKTTTGDTTAPPPATTAPPPPPPPPLPPPPPSPPKPAVTTISIVFRDGKVVGGLARKTVKKGDKVVLVVRSDVADEMHLHGYDKSVDVAAGRAARLAFVASLPGRFEVELEDRGLAIATLEVRP